jgi:hypothetical protein
MGTTAASINAQIYLGVTNASPIDETFNLSIETTTDTAEDTAHGDVWRTFIPTLSNFDGAIEKHVDFASGGGQLQAWQIARTVLKYYLYLDRNTTTVYWYGTCRLGGGGATMGLEDVVDSSFTIIPVSQPTYNHP